MQPSVSLNRNPDGTYTATIFRQEYVGTYEECVQWLRNNGEQVPAPRVPDSWLVPSQSSNSPPKSAPS